jgi:hypothetical protein
MIEGVESLVAPGRNYVKEGELTQYKSAKAKSGEKRHVFFFTDLILLTLKRGEKKFEHKVSVDLDSCKLVVLADSSRKQNLFRSIISAFSLTVRWQTSKTLLNCPTATRRERSAF